MITATIVWGTAAAIYAVFWVWYVGLKGKLSATDVEQYMQRFEAAGLPADKLGNLHQFLAKDDGREWFMVNLLELKSPKRESAKLLQSYSKVFMAGMLKRAGHPFFIANAKAKNIENLHCEQADNWTSSGIVRYRSRRDLIAMVRDPLFAEIHPYKLLGIPTTFSFPTQREVSLYMGPRVWVGLVLALAAALVQLVVLGS